MNNMHNTFHYLNGPEQCIDDIRSIEEYFNYDSVINSKLKIRMIDDANILNKETHNWLKSRGLSRPRLLIFLKNDTNSKIHLDVDTPVDEWAQVVRPIRLRQVDYRNYLRTCAINWVYDTTGKSNITGVTHWYDHVSPPDMITTTDAGTGSMSWLNESQFENHLISICQHTHPITLFNTSIPHCIKGARDRLCISLRFDVDNDDNPSYEKMLQIFGNDVIVKHHEYNLIGTI